MAAPLVIERATAADWPAIWAILEPEFRSGETYVVDRGITEKEARAYWAGPEVKATFVARRGGGGGEVVGTCKLRTNVGGGGSHVSNAAFVVRRDARGRGVGRALCARALAAARARGYAAMQFNAVVASNGAAVRAWGAMGFATVGRVPGAFRPPGGGPPSDLLVMHRTLAEDAGNAGDKGKEELPPPRPEAPPAAAAAASEAPPPRPPPPQPPPPMPSSAPESEGTAPEAPPVPAPTARVRRPKPARGHTAKKADRDPRPAAIASWASHEAAVGASRATLGAADPAAALRDDRAVLGPAWDLRRAEVLRDNISHRVQHLAQLRLGTASKSGDVLGMECAVAAGADVHAKVYNWETGTCAGLVGTLGGRYTAAAVAARHNNRAGLRFLVGACGADPHAADGHRAYSPMHGACGRGHGDALVVMLALGADPNTRDAIGLTCLQWAAFHSGSVPCLRALLAGGPGGALSVDHVNATFGDGADKQTALDFAFEAGHGEFAKVLRGELGGKTAKELLQAHEVVAPAAAAEAPPLPPPTAAAADDGSSRPAPRKKHTAKKADRAVQFPPPPVVLKEKPSDPRYRDDGRCGECGHPDCNLASHREYWN